jgi:hypothetical protein
VRRLVPALALVVFAAGCGPAEEPAGQLGFDLFISRATADLVASFQVSLLAKGTSFDCVAVQKNCLVAQVNASALVPVTDAQGNSHTALVFPVLLKAGSPRTQDVVVNGIPVGKDFAVVIEALSKGGAPTLVGSSCNYVKEIAAGSNPTLIAATITSTPVACDPRFEK